MGVVVELGAVEGFILDDPVAGVLDNTVYTLGGTVFKDISSRVLGLSTSRGKNRDLDRFSAGSLSVTLTNNDRAFDPNYASSPYAGAIVPRRELQVTVDGVRVITTTIDDWDMIMPRWILGQLFRPRMTWLCWRGRLLPPGLLSHKPQEPA